MGSAEYAYVPSFISTTSAPGYTQLVAFPPRGEPRKIPIRNSGPPFAYSPDGTALYGQCTPYPSKGSEPLEIAFCKIDLKTGSTTPVPGSERLIALDVAVSPREDCILVSGLFEGERNRPGLFQLTLANGNIRSVLVGDKPSVRPAWRHLSISADSTRALASYKGRLELVDLAQGKTESLANGLFAAAWSPDGEWLAAVEDGDQGRTILMDAKTLQRRRTLGASALGWSPDSHYLIGTKSCGPDFDTLETIDVGTGGRAIVESSRCQVNQATIGWVSKDVFRK